MVTNLNLQFNKLYLKIKHLIHHNILGLDIHCNIDPIVLKHIRRYEFARDNIRGISILDIACGTGYGYVLLGMKKGYLGVDFDEKVINFAKSNFQGNYKCSSIFTVGIKDETYDNIISFETLEHLDNPKECLELYSKWLKRDGKIIISVPLLHPDRIYHKKVYRYSDVIELINSVKSLKLSSQSIQSNYSIKLINNINDKVKGTFIGILKKKNG